MICPTLHVLTPAPATIKPEGIRIADCTDIVPKFQTEFDELEPVVGESYAYCYRLGPKPNPAGSSETNRSKVGL